MAEISPNIFREYDVRGIYGSELTLRDAELIGRAYGTVVKRSGGKLFLWAETAD